MNLPCLKLYLLGDTTVPCGGCKCCQHQKTGNTDQNGPGPAFLYFVGDAGSFKKENIDGRPFRINHGLLVATLER